MFKLKTYVVHYFRDNPRNRAHIHNIHISLFVDKRSKAIQLHIQAF
jgi:hypothetical protein